MQQKDYRDDITIIPNKVCLQLPYYIGTVKKKKKREKKKRGVLRVKTGEVSYCVFGVRAVASEVF